MKRSSTPLALGASVALLLGACSESSTAPQSESLLNPLVNADLVTVAADGAGEDVDIMRDPMMKFAGIGLAPTVGPDFNTDNCSYDATARSYTCTWTRDGLTITRVFTFYDAAGHTMASYDAQLTASANIRTTVQGDVTRDKWSASVERERNLTVTGLQGDEQKRTWNGTGTFTVGRSVHRDNGPSRTYDITGTLTVTDVVVPHSNNPGKDPWPLSGTVKREMTVNTTNRNGEAVTFTRSITITFNGTQFADATVVGPAGTKTFTIDLSLRKGFPKP